MTQNSQCGCDHPQLTMLSVHGLSLAVDASQLCPSQPTPPTPVIGGRERVNADMHIYINGNLTKSGDGLTPETAVKSYEDAVLALSRYDGCNIYKAIFHFTDLEANVAYPDIRSLQGHHSTFASLQLEGASYQTTKLSRIRGMPGTYLIVSNMCCTSVETVKGWITVSNKISISSNNLSVAPFHANVGGTICFGINVEVYLNPGSYISMVYAIVSASVFNEGTATFHTLGSVSFAQGCIYAVASSNVRITYLANFSDCASVSGSKYQAIEMSCISAENVSLPGSSGGTTATGSIFVG